MTPHHEAPVLAADEPPAVEVVNPAGRHRAVLLCDHASCRVPRRLSDLGLAPDDLRDHIGWDPGAADLARALSRRLDAPLVLSGYSRLVIDCNRPPGAPTSIPGVSGGVVVPGNAAVHPTEAEARAAACFWPYHRAVTALLDARHGAGVPTAILAVHSFTPVLLGDTRPWVCGMLWGRDRTLAGALIDALRGAHPDLAVGDNEPYRVTDAGDYTIPVHAEARGLHGVLIEVRNDQLRSAAGIETWATRLERAVRAALPPE